MQLSFYEKIQYLQQKISTFHSLEDVKNFIKYLSVNILVKYSSNGFFSYEESLVSDYASGILQLHIETTVTNEEKRALGKPTTIYIEGKSLSKKNVEKEKFNAILRTLQHLEIEE